MELDVASPRSRLVALLLCFFLGVFGAHRFYVGKIGTGVVMLVTLGGLGIWMLIDLILLAFGSLRDREGRRVYNWLEPAPAASHG
jgi:TM2 domain-containing membrane protein YozV